MLTAMHFSGSLPSLRIAISFSLQARTKHPEGCSNRSRIMSRKEGVRRIVLDNLGEFEANEASKVTDQNTKAV